jgi:sulfonate transport system permease protein
MSRRESAARRVWLGTRGWALPALLLAGWQWASRQRGAWAYAFAPLDGVVRALLAVIDSGELQANLLATGRMALCGLLLGGTLGMAFGAALGSSRIFERLFGAPYHALRQVPLLGWIPLLGLWFGQGDTARLIVVSLASFYPLVLNTSDAFRHVDPNQLEVARVLGLSRTQQIRYLLVPQALPSILTGWAQALAFCWVATVGSELLFGAPKGIGGMMQVAQNGSRMDIVVLCMACIGLVGFVANAGVGRLRDRLLRWRPTR